MFQNMYNFYYGHHHSRTPSRGEGYKYQPYVEKRFSQLKTDLEVAPVYLKKPHRCAGLVHAYYVALAVSSLIERAVRQGMKRKGDRRIAAVSGEAADQDTHLRADTGGFPGSELVRVPARDGDSLFSAQAQCTPETASGVVGGAAETILVIRDQRGKFQSSLFRISGMWVENLRFHAFLR
ncbi:MAG: hypothetical protein HY796_05905 [Elusimicrobia bacterium]|nr:hypothetical protein [Elusimicrobiota bacterium]